MQVTPLQLAVAYSALANGGTIVRPHLGLTSRTPTARSCRRSTRRPSRHIHINPLYLDTIRAGLHDAAQSARRHLRRRDGQLPEQVYGKTGTAQYNGQPDYSWYACFVPPSGDHEADRGRGARRAGRLRCRRRGAGRPADPVAVVLRQAGRVRGRRLADAVSAHERDRRSTAQVGDETARRGRAAARGC